VIRGVGVDVVSVERVARLLERRGPRFLERCFAPDEVRRAGDAQHVAGLLAAKEAAFKALATGWGAGVGWRDVIVGRRKSGAPELRLEGGAADRAARLGVSRCHLSITHDAGVAVALVVLEGADPQLDGDSGAL
jgi:holo-[acyl-carrier protein] synthase